MNVTHDEPEPIGSDYRHNGPASRPPIAGQSSSSALGTGTKHAVALVGLSVLLFAVSV